MSKFKTKLRYFYSVALTLSCLASPSKASDLTNESQYNRPLVAAGVLAVAGVAYYYGIMPDVTTSITALPCDPAAVINTTLAARAPFFFVNSSTLFQVAIEVPSKAAGWTSQLFGWISECYNPLVYTTYGASQSCLEFCYRRMETLGRTTEPCLAFIRCFSNGTQVLTCDFYRGRWWASVNAIYNGSKDVVSLSNHTNSLLSELQFSHPNLTFHWASDPLGYYTKPLFHVLWPWYRTLNFWGIDPSSL